MRVILTCIVVHPTKLWMTQFCEGHKGVQQSGSKDVSVGHARVSENVLRHVERQETRLVTFHTHLATSFSVQNC